MEKITTIRISEFTKNKLEQLGKKGESFEDIIIRVLTEQEMKGGK